MMIVAYDRSVAPPGPVFSVSLSAPGSSLRIQETALLDTGADFSVLPVGLHSILGLPAAGNMLVAGVDGVAKLRRFWRAMVNTPAGTFPVRAVEWGDEVIIGRDILNSVDLRFDGPRLQVSF